LLQSKPLFDYISYCKYLRYDQIIDCARYALCLVCCEEGEEDYDNLLNLEREIFKLHVSKCSSIKYLDIRSFKPIYHSMNHLLSEFPGAVNCFSNLCELHCNA